MKYTMRNSGELVSEAILHMIGQMGDMSQIVKTSDIARFLDVTKQTAQRYLIELMNRGYLQCAKEHYRKNATCFHWKLSDKASVMYTLKQFTAYYKLYMNNKLENL